jgi:DNA-binding CsgD family transcriptional regulator
MSLRSEMTLEDQVVAGLYRAAAGEQSWVNPLTDLMHLFGAWGAQLLGVRVADGGVAFSHDSGGPTPQGVLEYLRHYHRIDPRANLVMSMPQGQWISCHDNFDDTFVARNAFYRDYLIPCGGRYVSGAKIYQDEDLIVLIGIHRGRGSLPLNAGELGLCRRLGQHIETSLGMWRRLRSQTQHALVGRAVLSQLAVPVMLVDEQLQIHYRNDAASSLLSTGAAIAERSGLLFIRPAEQQAELLLALKGLRAGQSPNQAVDRRRLVRAGAPQEPGVLLVLSPLHPAETLGAFGERSLMMVLVHDPATRLRHDPLVVATLYGLTPAEAAVAVAIAAGDEVREIAQRHGVAVATVRAQLHAVFAKMGLSRQAEVAIALAHLPALGMQHKGSIERMVPVRN